MRGLSTLARRGIAFSLTCPEPCTFDARLLRSKQLLGRRSGGLTAAARTTVRVKLSARGRKALSGRRPHKLTLEVAVRGGDREVLLHQRLPLRFR
jgi:hypothetical protein